jgi:hypothetical protein
MSPTDAFREWDTADFFVMEQVLPFLFFPIGNRRGAAAVFMFIDCIEAVAVKLSIFGAASGANLRTSDGNVRKQ